MNIELFEKLKAFFRASPKALDMGLGGADTECGTVGCIAGWACMLNGIDAVDLMYQCSFLIVLRIAMNELGCANLSSPTRLFYISSWPDDLSEKIDPLCPGTQQYAEVVCEAIDRYVARDFNYWSISNG